jgi:hypothetical protein
MNKVIKGIQVWIWETSYNFSGWIRIWNNSEKEHQRWKKAKNGNTWQIENILIILLSDLDLEKGNSVHTDVGKMSGNDLTRSQGFLTSRHLTSHSLTFAQPPNFGTDRVRQTGLPEGITRGEIFLSWPLNSGKWDRHSNVCKGNFNLETA